MRGSRVLIIEDEYYLADDLSGALRAAGAEVVGPVGRLEEAEEKVSEGGFDCAILDINLHGERSFPIAERLEKAGIPFLIATGYNSASLPERYRAGPILEKPYEPAKVATAIGNLMQRA